MSCSSYSGHIASGEGGQQTPELAWEGPNAAEGGACAPQVAWGHPSPSPASPQKGSLFPGQTSCPKAAASAGVCLSLQSKALAWKGRWRRGQRANNPAGSNSEGRSRKPALFSFVSKPLSFGSREGWLRTHCFVGLVLHLWPAARC